MDKGMRVIHFCRLNKRFPFEIPIMLVNMVDMCRRLQETTVETL